MSVINKMLRDLDRRQAGPVNGVQAPVLSADMARGTRVVADAFVPLIRRNSRFRWGLVMAAAVLAGSVAGGWYWGQSRAGLPWAAPEQTRLATAPVAVVPVVTAVPQVPQVAPVAAPVAEKLPVPSTQGARPNPALKMDSTFSGRSVRPLGASATDIAAVTQPAPPQRSEPQQPPSPPPLPPPAPPPPASVSVPFPLVSTFSPALEVLAQAQRLWLAGKHDAGMDLLREALTAAEHTTLADPLAGHSAGLIPMARELARMELAAGRVNQALALLTRLEPVLADEPDTWAVRGNAAQRLGRHREAVAAYLNALRLRPDEPRWMLGAAVSLAVQGQVDRAAELAEKARTGGVLNPEVASYLRQLGVPLSTP